MRKVLILTAIAMLGAGAAGAASRDSNAVARTTTTGPRTGTTLATGTMRSTTSARTTANTSARPTATRAAVNTTQRNSTQTISRTATRGTTAARGTSATTPARAAATAVRGASSIVSRAAATATSMSDTRTGIEYERCKTAYFTCMDQFCALKNDDYRRCSCSDRVVALDETRDVLQTAGQKLTVFTENLDVVGMTAAQAAAMRTASDGENALTSDTSASKALLQAIMNSIRGQDTNVGGKYSDLNSINISFDTVNAFGITDSAQVIASYNAQNLYNAVYPQCRDAVRADCNDASLQRAITAYLMAIEQDCNTVQTAISETQKQMKAAVREGSAMLDLARVENRQKHNADDISTCLAGVESAILSEEVCGANYHKCLDNGEFIDVSTGAPITGVVRFYELEKLLTFNTGVAAADQKLSTILNNRTFVQNFEKRTRKFAEPALDRCTEMADVVWAEYLDKALLDIYYAQRAKVAQIKQGCFDFVSTCYMNGDTALTSAMRELMGDAGILLQPDKVALNGQLCRDYVQSCNNMFTDDNNKDIVAQFIQTRQDTDTLTACRAIVQQCFDKYGGTNYENFYYPYSGLFTRGAAPDWFTLYEYKDGVPRLKSECAKQLANVDACNRDDIIRDAFGGFDSYTAKMGYSSSQLFDAVYYIATNGTGADHQIYGMAMDSAEQKSMYPSGVWLNGDNKFITPSTVIVNRRLRSTGVATEVYNQLVDILSTQCINLNGRFVEPQFIQTDAYEQDNVCISKFESTGIYGNFITPYGISKGENMCPRDYTLNVDTASWGACLCWENGARRSKNGQSATCMAVLPTATTKKDAACASDDTVSPDGTQGFDNWCTPVVTSRQQVCPIGYTENLNHLCGNANAADAAMKELQTLPEGIY